MGPLTIQFYMPLPLIRFRRRSSLAFKDLSVCCNLYTGSSVRAGWRNTEVGFRDWTIASHFKLIKARL
jgi:hypothetical protein